MTDYAALLTELAVPRLVGSPHHESVRATLRRELTARGWTIEEHAFTARPSRLLFGTPKLVRGVNLIAHRPSGRPAARPTVWLMAHYDSKGQPISMATRIGGAAAITAGIVALVVAAATGVSPWPALVILVVGVAIMFQNRATNGSPGAVDNASALVAVFMAIDQLERDRGDVGVVFTDAEELGLLGARALARDRPELVRGAAIVNLDGLDDTGTSRLVMHRRGPVGRALAAALGIRRSWWLPVVVDGLALTSAAECVTVLRGDWRTARIVHTPRDAAARLTLAGARAVAGGVARALARP